MSEGDNVWRSDSSGFISGYFIFTNEECNGQIGMKRLHEKLGERIYLGQAITNYFYYYYYYYYCLIHSTSFRATDLID